MIAGVKRARIRRKSKSPGRALKNKLTVAFNAMIRERDGSEPCLSCQERSVTEAGHFVGCTPLSTRWHPENVNGQCSYCNAWQSGNRFAYGLNLNKKFGAGTAEKLELLGRRSWKPSREALEKLLEAAKLGAEAYSEIWNFYGSEDK